MSSLHLKILDVLNKHYITNKDLEYRNYTPPYSASAEYPLGYYSFSLLYDINISDSNFTSLNNNYLSTLANWTNAVNVNDFFDAPPYFTTNSNTSYYSAFDLTINSDVEVMNNIAVEIFNLRAVQMFDYDNMSNDAINYKSFRYIQLNDYASSFISIPIIAVLHGTNFSLPSSPSNTGSIADRRRLFDIFMSAYANKVILYFDNFILDYYFSPEHLMEDYTMNNIQSYGMLCLSAYDLFFDYFWRRSDRITVKNKIVGNLVEIQFDIFLREENVFLEDDTSTTSGDSMGILYNPLNYNFDILTMGRNDMRLVHESDFRNRTGFVFSNIRNVETIYQSAINNQNVMVIQPLTISNSNNFARESWSSLLINEYYSNNNNRFYINNLYQIIPSIQYYSSLDELYSRFNVEYSNGRFVFNKVKIAKIIFADIYPVVYLCNGSQTVEKVEGEIKYTKVRFFDGDSPFIVLGPTTNLTDQQPVGDNVAL